MFCIVLKFVLSLFYQSKRGHKTSNTETNFKTYKIKIMKTQSQSLFNQLSKPAIENLTTQVSETVAKEFGNSQTKTFGVIDMWNLHRQRKTINCR